MLYWHVRFLKHVSNLKNTAADLIMNLFFIWPLKPAEKAFVTDSRVKELKGHSAVIKYYLFMPRKFELLSHQKKRASTFHYPNQKCVRFTWIISKFLQYISCYTPIFWPEVYFSSYACSLIISCCRCLGPLTETSVVLIIWSPKGYNQ